MLLKIAYLLIRRILDLAMLEFRKDLAKEAELLVLLHENAVYAATPAGSGTSQLTGYGLPR